MPRTQWWTLNHETGMLERPNLMWAQFDGRADSATRAAASGVDCLASRRIAVVVTNVSGGMRTPENDTRQDETSNRKPQVRNQPVD